MAPTRTEKVLCASSLPYLWRREKERRSGYATARASPSSLEPKPLLKWVGGKTQIIDAVMELFPRTMRGYHEPFLGGGSVLLALLAHKRRGSIEITGPIRASDINLALIALFRNVQTKPEELIRELRTLLAHLAKCGHTTPADRDPATMEEALASQESLYYWVRSQYNALHGECRTSVAASAMLLFLNKLCFRGLYREGPNGFNVPFGHYKNPSVFNEAHVREVSSLIQGVEFTHASFEESVRHARAGDFVYMDPPYAPECDASFVSYTCDGFDGGKHRALFELCAGMEASGVGMLMSNADVASVRRAFPTPSFATRVIRCRRRINSKRPNAHTNEVLITNCAAQQAAT
jgi:DNA adenine methylase